MIKKIIFIIVYFTIFSSYTYAHGVKGKLFSGGIGIKAQYSTGEPMSYAQVKILEQNKKMPYQIGRTDKNGCFCFYPDKPGNWKAVINDGFGHELQIPILVDKNFHYKLQNIKESFTKKILKIFIALLSITGFFSILSYFKKIKN